MILIVRGGLDAIPRDEPLPRWRIVAGIGLRLFDVVSFSTRSDIIGIDRVTISIATTSPMKNGVSLGRVPTVSIGIAGQGNGEQGQTQLQPPHGFEPLNSKSYVSY